MNNGMTPLQWARNRAWLQEELDRTRKSEDRPNGYGTGWYDGYHLAIMKVFSRMFLTEEEQIESERVRREMFG